MTIVALQPYARYFAPAIPRTPAYRYASILLLRETKSYAIFTTEGGEQQDVEETQSGLSHTEVITRLVMFKRKQAAPERRTGKALLRQYGIFPYAILSRDGKVQTVAHGEEAIERAKEQAKGKGWSLTEPYLDCYLTEGLCTHCPDCLIYGYAAVEGEGARKARLITDTCFTIRPYELIQKQVKFNVINEASQTSGTITEYDYTMPGVFLPSIETTVDLTLDEFVYVLGNLLRTTRYGKEGSRQGFMRNHILAIAFSDAELFANLELTQALYDALVDEAKLDLATRALTMAQIQPLIPGLLQRLTANLAGRLALIQGGELDAVLQEVRALNRDEARLRDFLMSLHAQSASFVV